MTEDICRNLFNSMDDGFCIIDVIFDESGAPVDWRYLETNPQYVNHGGSPDDVGQLLSARYPGTEPVWLEFCGNVAVTGISARLEGEFSPLSKWFEASAYKVGDACERKVAVLFRDITGNKRIEEALRESEEKYRALVKHAPAGIYELDLRRNRFISVNDVMCELTGFTREEFLNMNPAAILDEKGIATFKTRLTQWLKGEEPGPNIDYKVKTKFGNEIYASLNVQFTKDMNGEPLGATVIAHDVSERRRIEEALRESEERLRFVLKSCNIGAWQMDLKNHTTIRNPEHDKTYGYDAMLPEWTYEIFLEHVIPEDRARVNTVFQNAVKEKIGWTFEFRVRWPDGQIRWIWASGSQKPDPDGMIRRVAGTVIDVTEKKLAEEALRVNEKRQAFLLKLSDMLRPLSDPVAIQDAATGLISKYMGTSQANYGEHHRDRGVMRRESVNDASPSRVGTYKHKDFSGSMAVLLSGNDLVISDIFTAPGFSDEERARFASLNIIANLSVPLIKDNQLVATFSVRQTTPRVWTPDEIELVHEVAERTWASVERARAEEALRESEQKALTLIKELEEADKNKNQFIAVLSHELRNPLAVIVASLSLLEVANSPQQISLSKEIVNREVSQLTKLVDDLLDLTRIKQNKIKLKKETIDLNEILKNAALDVKPQYFIKNIRLTVKLPKAPVMIGADPVRITQCVGNLLHNSLKYTQASGDVSLSLDIKKGEAVIRVRDNGMGIERELLEHLFEPFTQAEMSLDRLNGGGLGLGLSIVKGIVEMHGGRVKAFSEGVGQGSLFTIRLPGLIQSTSAKSSVAAKNSDRHFKILLIDDNKNLTQILCAMLDVMGHDACAAHSGPEGITEAKKIRPDVIFCDIGLPGLNGYEVAKSLKADAALQNAFLIALTGYAGAFDFERARMAGFDRHLAKPVAMPALEKVLAEIEKY